MTEEQREKAHKRQKRYYESHREEILRKSAIASRAYYKKHSADPEWRLENSRRASKWEAENKERRSVYAKAHYAEHKEEYKARVLRRIREDVSARLAHYARTRLGKFIKRRSRSKPTIELFGCSLQELIQHLESRFRNGMSWENWGRVWHVDHIRPLSSFDLKKPTELAAACHYTNLQPLFATENLSKGNRIAKVLGEGGE